MTTSGQRRGAILVLDSGATRGALAAVRSLDAAGWLVGVGTPHKKGMVTASSACTWHEIVPWPSAGREDFVASINAAAASRGYGLVFGSGDDWATALSLNRDAIVPRVAHPPADVMLASVDKNALTEIARKAAVRVPLTVDAGGAEMDAWTGPAVVKTRAHWIPEQVLPGERLGAMLCHTPEAIRQRVGEVADAGGDPVLQEVVEGELVGFALLLSEGQVLGRLQQRMRGKWPLPAGSTTRAETVAIDEELAAQLVLLLKILGWDGLMQMELIYPRSGDRPYLIDLNGRFYGQLELAHRAGLDLAAMWAEALSGNFVPPHDAVPGIRFSWLEGDLRRAFGEKRTPRTKDIWESLLWSLRADAAPIFRTDDVRPALVTASDLAGRTAAKLGDRAASALRELRSG